MIPVIDFQPMVKIARLNREMIITEKIDGTNSSVYIDDLGGVFAGSRTRWITPQDDNYGFARWVQEHADDLRLLGPGLHRGEWWGAGIQRAYGLKGGDKRFSLFNTSRWCAHDGEPRVCSIDPKTNEVTYQQRLPECCRVVPELYRGKFNTEAIEATLQHLKFFGSQAEKGFMKPEGIVVFHTAANTGFKVTIEKDDQPKSKVV